MRLEKTDHETRKDMLEGSPALKIQAEKLMIEAAEQARREKNFALADSIRQELLQQGIVLEDTKEGVRWKKIK